MDAGVSVLAYCYASTFGIIILPESPKEEANIQNSTPFPLSECSYILLMARLWATQLFDVLSACICHKPSVIAMFLVNEC